MRLHDPEDFLKPSGRPQNIAVGLVTGLLALIFLYLACQVLWGGLRLGLLKPPLVDRGKLAFLSVPLVLLALGIPGAWVAYRLMSGRRRRDGGLLSPWMLRFSGVLFFVAPWFYLVGDPSDFRRWQHTVTLVIGGIACWILAARRERRDALDEVHSVPFQRPID